MARRRGRRRGRTFVVSGDHVVLAAYCGTGAVDVAALMAAE